MFLGCQAPKGFTISHDFNFGVDASREGLIEKRALFSRKLSLHEMKMSDHGFYAPKRFIISPGNFGTKDRPKCRKFKNRILISSFFLMVFGSVGGQIVF